MWRLASRAHPRRTSPRVIPKYAKNPSRHDSTLGSQADTSVRRHKITSIKYAYRGGQNLSERYKRLEKSLRGKTAFGLGGNGVVLGNVAEPRAGVTIPQESGTRASSRPLEDVIVFKGIEIPNEPKPPESDECCMSGCAVCVYDLYEEAMERYIEGIEEAKIKLRKMGVAESEWPSVLFGKGRGGEGEGGRKNVVMDAFEQLERELSEKRAAEAGTRAGEGGFLMLRNVSEAVGWIIYSQH